MVVEDWFIYYMKGKNIFVLFGFYKVCYFDNGLFLKYVVWICDKYMYFCFNYGLVDVLQDRFININMYWVVEEDML